MMIEVNDNPAETIYHGMAVQLKRRFRELYR
jgi:hypothetical protein